MSRVVLEPHRGTWRDHHAYRLGAEVNDPMPVGAVIDGGTRGLAAILDIPGWAVFARYVSPIESRQRWRQKEFQVPIFMSGTLKRMVRVNPGDWIVDDADGVLVVPAAAALEALVKTEAVEQDEAGARRDLQAGMSLPDVYRKYRRL